MLNVCVAAIDAATISSGDWTRAVPTPARSSFFCAANCARNDSISDRWLNKKTRVTLLSRSRQATKPPRRKFNQRAFMVWADATKERTAVDAERSAALATATPRARPTASGRAQEAGSLGEQYGDE